MRAWGTGKKTKAWLLNSALLFSCTCFIATANAQDARHQQSESALVKPTTSLQPVGVATHRTLTSGVMYRSHGISCVPYARKVSGIEVPGNAWQWWRNAQGHYARGDQPEIGSVLNFRSNGRMRLGHVAVVTKLVNARELIIDHANWPSDASRGNITRNVAVVDVSEANNWSAVRVELGRSGRFGSVYPTYGFIYNRPDSGLVAANVTRPAPQAVINPVPSDLRPVAERPWRTREEVAELPADSTRRAGPQVASQSDHQ